MHVTIVTFLNVLLAFGTLFALAIASFTQINADVGDIDQRATSLKNLLVDTDGSSYLRAISIDAAAIRLDSSIQQGTKDVMATPHPVSESDARNVIAKLKATASTVDVISTRLIAIKDNLQKSGAASIAKQTLVQVTENTKTFAKALIDKTPESVKTDAVKVQEQISAALDKAVAAYQ